MRYVSSLLVCGILSVLFAVRALQADTVKSPGVWPNSNQSAAYQDGKIVVSWSDTSPFNYDFFIVRWDRDGVNVGQQDVNDGPRTSGTFAFDASQHGLYRIVIEGCDGHFLSSSTCRQGWTTPIMVKVDHDSGKPCPPNTQGCPVLPCTPGTGSCWGPFGGNPNPPQPPPGSFPFSFKKGAIKNMQVQ
jgi:hypothetical protein